MLLEHDDRNNTYHKKLNDEEHDDDLLKESYTDKYSEERHKEVLEKWYAEEKDPINENDYVYYTSWHPEEEKHIKP